MLTEKEDDEDNKFAEAIDRIQRFVHFLRARISRLFRRKRNEEKTNIDEIVIFNQVTYSIMLLNRFSVPFYSHSLTNKSH